MKLKKYNDFLESVSEKYDILLEAKINFSAKFKEVLTNIDSPISKILLDLVDKDVDVNTNYIDINRDKNDMITYRPDDKINNYAKVLYVNNLSKHFENFFKNHKTNFGKLEEGLIVKIIDKRTTKEHFYTETEIFLLEWRKDGETYNAILNKESLEFGKDILKPTNLKVGRFVKSLLDKSDNKLDNTKIEEFVNKYKTEVSKLGNVFSRFELVEGEDIRHYYLKDNYESEKHTLGNSCMRYDGCQEYLDIYVDNPDSVKLLILRSDEDSSKICGRALLWNAKSSSNGNFRSIDGKFMDRIYVNNSPDEELFLEYARKNNFAYKLNNGVEYKGEILSQYRDEIYVVLDNCYFEYYPYMDTLKYYDPNSGRLSSLYGCYTLESTEGYHTCVECGGDGEIECQNCDGNGYFECEECDGRGRVDCDDCNGSGKVDGEECSECNGDGDLECNRCGGDGSEECSDCGGNRYVSCPNCS